MRCTRLSTRWWWFSSHDNRTPLAHISYISEWCHVGVDLAIFFVLYTTNDIFYNLWSSRSVYFCVNSEGICMHMIHNGPPWAPLGKAVEIEHNKMQYIRVSQFPTCMESPTSDEFSKRISPWLVSLALDGWRSHWIQILDFPWIMHNVELSFHVLFFTSRRRIIAINSPCQIQPESQLPSRSLLQPW